MKYICNYSWAPDSEQQTEAIRRFKESGGRVPAGVKLLGRWTRADFMGGVALMETDDGKALTEFALMWSDLMELDVVPVVDDQELVEVLGRVGK